MMMKSEIEIVKKLTGATDKQIKFVDGEFGSRAYLINGGELVVKFPKLDIVNYRDEARILDYFNKLDLPVSVQKVKWMSEDGRCIVFYGVKGMPLSKIKNLTLQQKQAVATKIGAFLKQIRTLEPDFCEPPAIKPKDMQLDGQNNSYTKLKDFYSKHFTKDECDVLDKIYLEYLPKERAKLGDEYVFTHGDIWNPNVLIDEDGNVGVIDCGDARYHEESVDFGFEDEELRKMVLDSFGASETLRRKVELRNDILWVTYPNFVIAIYGEDEAGKKCVPIIRRIINKYESFV